MRTRDQGFHPFFRVLAVVDLCPGVAGAEVVWKAVVVGKAVVWFGRVRWKIELFCNFEGCG